MYLIPGETVTLDIDPFSCLAMLVGLNNGEVYEMTKSFARAKALGEKMNNAEVQPDSVIRSIHPHFQPVLLALNDSHVSSRNGCNERLRTG